MHQINVFVTLLVLLLISWTLVQAARPAESVVSKISFEMLEKVGFRFGDGPVTSARRSSRSPMREPASNSSPAAGGSAPVWRPSPGTPGCCTSTDFGRPDYRTALRPQ